MAIETGSTEIREESIDRAINLLAKRSYKFKQLCTIKVDTANAQKYWIEPSADLAGGAGHSIEDTPRGIDFPDVTPNWTEATTYNIKYAAKSTMYWEDIISNEIDIASRTVELVTRAIVKQVDTNIWNVLTENQTPDKINTLAIDIGAEWDSENLALQNPIQNLLDATKLIEEDDYDADNAYLLLNPKNYANLMGNASVRNATTFFTDSVTRNGRLGSIAGLTIIKSNNVTPDKAAIVIAKAACTWVQGAPLKSETTTKERISRTIRASEMGVAQLRNPLAICFITNTDA